MLRIVPTVELEPSEIQVDNFIELHESGRWESFWADTLRRYELWPLSPGSWQIPLSCFKTHTALDLLLTIRLEEDGKEITELEEISTLCGGYAFLNNDIVELEPGCCCDLSDLEQWRTATERKGELTPLSIGHAFYSLQSDPEATRILIFDEGSRDQLATLSYNPEEFTRALDDAELERQTFAKLLAARLEARGTAKVAEVVGVLVFGRY